MNLFKVTFIIFFFCFGQNIFSQKYSFKIQSQYSHYENENSEKANSKIVFLFNNEDDTTMSFFVVNDTIKNISIFDKKSRKVFFSQGGFVLDGKTNLNYIFSTCKFDLREFFYDEKINKNVTISNDIIDGEMRRLLNLGYEGDVLDKMFKSARYYFRKKGTEKKTPAERRQYIGVQKELLDVMDNHITAKINRNDCKPSESFDDFCKNNISVLQEEICILVKNGITNTAEIKEKIKKTYKNRYFLQVKHK